MRILSYILRAYRGEYAQRLNQSFILLCLVTGLALPARSQVTFYFNHGVDAGMQGLSGNLRICNNSSGPLPAGYSIEFRWPAFNGYDWGPSTTQNGTGDCDTWTFSFESWQLPANGACGNVSAGGSSGNYTPPLAYPPYGIDQFGDTIWVLNGGDQYIPKSYNQSDWEYYFDEECFVPSPSTLCLGEAQLREWNDPWDVRVPQNRKGWALAAAHIATLFNNMVGADVVSINYAFSQSMIEGRMGCDAGFNPPGGDNNPLQFAPISTAAGCFQILSGGWAQIEQFYPTLTAPLTHADIIAGDNFITAGLSKALYDMTTFTKYEKMNCADPIGFFVNSADEYAAEELLAYAYHEGPFGSEGTLEHILVTNRATLLGEANLAEYMQLNMADGSTQYAERMRNNLIQLENNFGVPGGPSTLSPQAQTNWVGGSPPNDYEWHGCYDEPFTWADIDAYIDEAATLFWTGNVPAIKAQVQTVFNSINGGAAVNYSQLGPVIDAIVLGFPAYSPDEGLGETYFATACGSPTVSMSSCDEICPDENGQLWVHLMGTPPFSYTIEGPTGTIYSNTNVNVATDVVYVNQPGTYKVLSIEDANGEVFLNCHNASAAIIEAADCSLPVSLLSFTAHKTATGDVQLEWRTASEKNNSHFNIERSLPNGQAGTDGVNYEVIGVRTGQGTTNQATTYRLTDRNPQQGINYYRLAQYDYDGSVSYSPVRQVAFDAGVAVHVYPNPSTGAFYISTSGSEDDIHFTLTNVSGQVLENRNLPVGEIAETGAHLPSGVYILRLTSRTYSEVVKLVKE